MTSRKKVTSIYVDLALLGKFRRKALNECIDKDAKVQGALKTAYEEAMILWLAIPEDERTRIVNEWRNGEDAAQIPDEARQISQGSVSPSRS